MDTVKSALKTYESTEIKILTEFLAEEDAVPFYDESGKIVTFRGGDAKIRAGAIRECIRRVKNGQKTNEC